MKEGRGQTRALWHEDWRGNPSLFLSPRMAQTQGIVTRFVVAVKIWELWDNGHVGELAAFSLVIAIGTVMVGSIFLKNSAAPWVAGLISVEMFQTFKSFQSFRRKNCEP